MKEEGVGYNFIGDAEREAHPLSEGNSHCSDRINDCYLGIEIQFCQIFQIFQEMLELWMFMDILLIIKC